MDGQVMFWMTFCSLGLLGDKYLSTKVLPHRCKQLPPCAQNLKRHGIHSFHLHSMRHEHLSTLQVEHDTIFDFSHSWHPRKWMDAT